MTADNCPLKFVLSSHSGCPCLTTPGAADWYLHALFYFFGLFARSNRGFAWPSQQWTWFVLWSTAAGSGQPLPNPAPVSAARGASGDSPLMPPAKTISVHQPMVDSTAAMRWDEEAMPFGPLQHSHSHLYAADRKRTAGELSLTAGAVGGQGTCSCYRDCPSGLDLMCLLHSYFAVWNLLMYQTCCGFAVACSARNWSPDLRLVYCLWSAAKYSCWSFAIFGKFSQTYPRLYSGSWLGSYCRRCCRNYWNCCHPGSYCCLPTLVIISAFSAGAAHSHDWGGSICRFLHTGCSRTGMSTKKFD